MAQSDATTSATGTTGVTAGRPSIVGSDTGPEAPFPLRMEGKVISGFGRGSKELGIPTANLPVDAAETPWIESAKSGVYFGWASLDLTQDHPDRVSSSSSPSSGGASSPPPSLYPMVMSIGYNPFYKNTVRSAEVHLLHPFTADFYSCHMRLLLLGFVREEKDYKSLDALVEDIKFDCEVARASVARPKWAPGGREAGGENAGLGGENDEWLLGGSGVKA